MAGIPQLANSHLAPLSDERNISIGAPATIVSPLAPRLLTLLSDNPRAAQFKNVARGRATGTSVSFDYSSLIAVTAIFNVELPSKSRGNSTLIWSRAAKSPCGPANAGLSE